MHNYHLYAIDTETTGQDSIKNDVIELSIFDINLDRQKTWCLKPLNKEGIEKEALKINKHKYEDITWQTEYGKNAYLDPNKIIVDVENWLMEDEKIATDRVFIAQLAEFDYKMLKELWNKCNSADTFPFGRRCLDTLQIEFFLNLAQDEMLDNYSLNNIGKKYGIKNLNAHKADSDTLVCKEIFKKQFDFVKKAINSLGDK